MLTMRWAPLEENGTPQTSRIRGGLKGISRFEHRQAHTWWGCYTWFFKFCKLKSTSNERERKFSVISNSFKIKLFICKQIFKYDDSLSNRKNYSRTMHVPAGWWMCIAVRFAQNARLSRISKLNHEFWLYSACVTSPSVHWTVYLVLPLPEHLHTERHTLFTILFTRYTFQAFALLHPLNKKFSLIWTVLTDGLITLLIVHLLAKPFGDDSGDCKAFLESFSEPWNPP